MDRRSNDNSSSSGEVPQGYVDSLRMSPQEQREILSRLSQHEHRTDKNRRKKERLQYTNPAGLVVQMRHPGGTASNFLVRARNLSTMGIGFLHGSFVYTGTPCVLALRGLNGKIVGVEGRVARCQHVKAHVHDIGVAFDEPIKLSQFIMGQGEEEVAECGPSTELPKLRGKILIVEDSISDQDLIQFQLDSLSLTHQTVSNGLDAVDIVESVKFDAIITAMWLPGMTGAELAASLRESGYTGPIIAVTADDKAETRVEILARGCTEVLVKPYQLDDFIAAMSRHLPTDAALADAIPLESTLWGNEKMRPLICKFLSRLGGQVNEINRLVGTPGTEPLVQKFCMDLKGSAGGYGYPQISSAASNLLKEIAADGGKEKIKELVQVLMSVCHAASLALNQQGAALPQAERSQAKTG